MGIAKGWRGLIVWHLLSSPGVKSSIVWVNMDFSIAENGITASIAIRCAHEVAVAAGNMQTYCTQTYILSVIDALSRYNTSSYSKGGIF